MEKGEPETGVDKYAPIIIAIAISLAIGLYVGWEMACDSMLDAIREGELKTVKVVKCRETGNILNSENLEILENRTKWEKNQREMMKLIK